MRWIGYDWILIVEVEKFVYCPLEINRRRSAGIITVFYDNFVDLCDEKLIF